MIVRDETPVIKRCIDSVKNIIDGYLICDTGSIDGTPEMITSYMKELNIPGRVVHEKWKNFAHGRTMMKKHAYEDPVASKHTYFCWLDADEVYLNTETDEYPDENDKAKLIQYMNERPKVGIFQLITHFGGLHYPRWNLVRNNQLYYWKCPVHEYLVSTKPTGVDTISFIKLLARKEGNSSRDPLRSLKDVLMLEEAYLECPEKSPRECFYLGQVLQENGDWLTALHYYKLRTENYTSGFHQEKYIAMLRSGRIHVSMNKLTESLSYFEKAHNLCKHRIEAVYAWMNAYYKLQQYDEAYKVAKNYIFPNMLPDSDLFVEFELWDWQFLYLASLVASLCHEYDDAEKWLRRLLEINRYPEDKKQTIEDNLNEILNAKESRNRTVPLLNRTLSPIKLVVIDDFHSDPDKEREFALSQEYNVKGNYPGVRTKSFANDETKKLFEQILGKRITYWPGEYNGSYQKATDNLKSWVHRDLTDYAAIIYLTPDAPVNSGTTFYRHKKLGVEYENPSNKKQLDNDSSNYNAWDIVDSVGNKYNRLVIFNGRRSHSSTTYFGSKAENCRLFQLFFFDIEK